MGETKPAELQRFFAEGPERLPHGPTGKVVQRTIAELADALAGDASIADLLTTLLCASVALVPGAGCAKISVIDGGRLCSIAATSQPTSSLDSAQQAAGQGPCLDAISARTVALAESLRERLGALDGVTVHDKGARRCGIVTFSVAGREAGQVRSLLSAAKVNTTVSSRDFAQYDFPARGLTEVVRASPHYYNNDND